MALQSSASSSQEPMNTEMNQPKQNSLLLFMSILGLLAVIGFSVYFNLQKQAISEAHQKVQEENTKLSQEVKSLQSSKTQATQMAQQWIATIEQDEILWSRVLSRLQSLIPFDAASKKAKISFVSYSGSTGGVLSLNVQTRNASEAPYEDVAELLKSLNESSYFSRAVVPTLTPGQTDTGEKYLTFTLNVRYEEQALPELEETQSSPKNSPGTGSSSTPGPTPATPPTGTPRPAAKQTSP